MDNVIFVVGVRNFRSQRAVEKIGGIRVGMRPDANGRESVVFQITRNAFEQRPDELRMTNSSQPG